MDEADKSFEQQWGAAFDQAAQTPPKHVWVAIDGQLAHAEANQYKKRLVVYQWSAAAAVLLLIISGIGYWGRDWDNAAMQAHDPAPESTPAIRSTPSITQAENPVPTGVTRTVGQPLVLEPLRGKSNPKASKPISPSIQLPLIDETIPSSEVKAGFRTRTAHINEMVQLTNIPVELDPTLVPNALPVHLYGVPNTAFMQEESKQQLWAGVSMSSGSFDPAFKSSSTANQAMSSPIMDSQNQFTSSALNSNALSKAPLQYDPGYSISAGLNVGKRLKNRIILSTGVHYQSFNTADAETVVLQQGGDYYALTGSESDAVLLDQSRMEAVDVAEEEASLSNAYQYMSIPVKAGYILLDQRFNIILNTGLSSNFLIDATLRDHNNDQALSNDFDTSSNYESVYFNFMTSIEFGYVVFRKYQITLEPNYNQALTNFTNSNNTTQGKPTNLGIAFGLKYNF
ncbi:hypothetical protein [Reichenbachiella sp. MSK19-1]|uniref:outer membrane beta-barrel protein n=1 Tax=Reichenbachiella sp. MSK19-1 TaxID=1897631 RepID=UPI000E6B727F|nr:hypothetical protein [Reichenbachiella sp. MSK19-1]RJE70309.1 hypothetical protein BGP76_09405 [Reichenbachiella sp. MSK19-1]